MNLHYVLSHVNIRCPLKVFRLDDMGRDMVVGYGSVLLPTQAGRHERVAHMYAPKPSSVLQRFRSWISGAYPEVITIISYASGGCEGDVRRG